MPSSNREDSTQHGIARYLPVETLMEARNLVYRFQQGDAFRLYVLKRKWHLVPAALLILLTSISYAAATVVFFAEMGSLLALPALLLAPFVLIGSLFVQAYVWFSWLELRALARAYGQRARPPQGALAVRLWQGFGADLGKLPPVPWGMAAIFLFTPLAVLALVAAKAALVLIVLQVLTPILYARLDR